MVRHFVIGGSIRISIFQCILPQLIHFKHGQSDGQHGWFSTFLGVQKVILHFSRGLESVFLKRHLLAITSLFWSTVKTLSGIARIKFSFSIGNLSFFVTSKKVLLITRLIRHYCRDSEECWINRGHKTIRISRHTGVSVFYCTYINHDE